MIRWTGGGWQETAPCVFADPSQRIGYLIRRLDDLTELSSHDTTAYRNILFQAILIELRWILDDQNRIGEPEDVITRVRAFLDGNVQHPIDLKHLVARFALSRPTICRQFRQRFGSSPMAYLQQIRLKQALDLLTDSKVNIAEVAKKIGIRSPSYLAQMVKRHTGRSPRSWRGKKSILRNEKRK